MKYLRNEPLRKHTSFRIGGPADYFCVPGSVEELKEALLFAKERRLPVAVMGAGTNLLALDKGFRGLVIKLSGGLKQLKARGRTLYLGAGVLIPQLLNYMVRRGLGGVGFLAGIPGTVGGAVAMNAGAWGKEIGRYVDRVRLVDFKGKEVILKKKRMGFGYRKSVLQKGKHIVVEVVLKLRKSDRRLIKKKMKECLKQRKTSQPLGSPNAGSIFKNPRGKFAGKLLEEAGCKGLRIGDAQVSTKHSNFIVNLGEAKARDVIKLITRAQNLVKNKFKIRLEPELKIMVKSST
jgi:UDP-N-acetylmuramate dehydrogenase